MDIGIVGLGKMGSGLAARAREHGHRVVGWDPQPDARSAAREQAGSETVDELELLPSALEPPRPILLYVPHGAPVDETIEALAPELDPGDVIGDGGNSHWEDSVRRHARLDKAGISFLDVGTSGGTSEALGWQGAAFMVGGERAAFERIRPVLVDLAVSEAAVLHAGAPGAGHFVKLVHNAIEFGMLQSIAEGVELLVGSDFDLDLPGLFEHWNHGTVIRGWLVELMANALREETSWDRLSTAVEDTGEVKWVLGWATDRDIPLPVVSAAQTALMASRDGGAAAKALALLRHEFGGHPVHRTDEP